MTVIRIHTQSFTSISISDVEDFGDESFGPEAMLRAKAELLADYLGCTADEAEGLIFNRVTDIKFAE